MVGVPARLKATLCRSHVDRSVGGRPGLMWTPAPLMLVRTPLSCSVSTAGFYSRRSGRTPSTPRPSSSDRGPEPGWLDDAAVFPQQPVWTQAVASFWRRPPSLSARRSPGDAAHQGPSASGDPSPLCFIRFA